MTLGFISSPSTLSEKTCSASTFSRLSMFDQGSLSKNVAASYRERLKNTLGLNDSKS